jgi:hypothetical protein
MTELRQLFGIAAVGTLVLLAGCDSGPTDSTTNPDPAPVVLFEDTFDDGLGSWNRSNLEKIVIDDEIGDPSPPSMLMVGDGSYTATLNQSLFSVFQGLDIFIRVRPPPDDICGIQLAPRTPRSFDENLVPITNESGAVAAFVNYWRLPCDDAQGGTRFQYSIFFRDTGGTLRLTSVEETLAWGAVTGQFFDFFFSIGANGVAIWSRDGVTKVIFNPSGGSGQQPGTFNGTALGLKLHVRQGFTGAEPLQLDVHFDDVMIQR